MSTKITVKVAPSLSELVPQRIQYVLDFITNHPLNSQHIPFQVAHQADEGTINIQYGSDEKNTAIFQIPAQALFFKKQFNPKAPVSNEYTYNEQKLYAVQAQKSSTQAFLINGQFQFDIFETIFFHLSRYEEFVLPTTAFDQFGRVKADAQFLVRNHLEKTPVIDRLVFCFLDALKLNPPHISSQAVMTHDIDGMKKFSSPFTIFRKTGGVLWRQKNWPAVKKLWTSYYQYFSNKAPDPYDVFDWMLIKNLDKKIIYFLVDGNTPYDSPYPLKDYFKRVVQQAKSRGYHIGIHPSFDTFKNPERLGQEIQKLANCLDQPILFSRQHYLRFSMKETPTIIEDLGIQEDSSLGYNDRIGFRCGTGFSYHLYNFDEERPFKFLENPMVMMDYALILEGNFQTDRITAIWNDFLQQNKYFTSTTYLFHNSRFDQSWIENIPLKAMYLDLINQYP